MKVFLVVVQWVSIGYDVDAVFLDREKALAHRQWLADNDLVVQTRIMSGDPYPDPYEVEEMEVTE